MTPATYKLLETTAKKLVVSSAAASTYDALVLSDHPRLYVAASAVDLTGNGHVVSVHGAPGASVLPNGDASLVFNGVNQYVEVADAADLSASGAITIEAWMRPDVLTFPHFEGSGYVYWAGKGEPTQYEYASRMYNLVNEENRPNRISGYAFNPEGGLGVGSYFQDAIVAGGWLHYALVINTAPSAQFPQGYTKIYKNGALRDQDNLASLNIVPRDGSAPFRFGTRDFNSFFQGAIAKVAVHARELPAARVFAHYSAIVPPVVGTAKLVGPLVSKREAGAGTTLVLTVPHPVPAGRFLVARVGQDWSAAAPTIADSRGNVWSRDRSAADGGATLRASIFSAQVATALQEGDSITVTFPATTARAAAIDEFTQLLNPTVVDAVNGASGVSANPSGAKVTTAHANDLLVGMVIAGGGSGVAYSEDPAYNSLARVGNEGDILSVNGAYLSVAQVGTYQYKPSLDSAQTWVEAQAAYEAG